jgi:hypothetical protein
MSALCPTRRVHLSVKCGGDGGGPGVGEAGRRGGPGPARRCASTSDGAPPRTPDLQQGWGAAPPPPRGARRAATPPPGPQGRLPASGAPPLHPWRRRDRSEIDSRRGWGSSRTDGRRCRDRATTREYRPRMVDWGQLTPRLNAGEWVCLEHGRIHPRPGRPVPSCPHPDAADPGGHCPQLVSRVQRGPGGAPMFVEPAPSHCAGPGRHPLTGGQTGVGWTGCACAAAARNRGGHRTWTCGTCGDVQLWPPCRATDRPPAGEG